MQFLTAVLSAVVLAASTANASPIVERQYGGYFPNSSVSASATSASASTSPSVVSRHGYLTGMSARSTAAGQNSSYLASSTASPSPTASGLNSSSSAIPTMSASATLPLKNGSLFDISPSPTATASQNSTYLASSTGSAIPTTAYGNGSSLAVPMPSATPTDAGLNSSIAVPTASATPTDDGLNSSQPTPSATPTDTGLNSSQPTPSATPTDDGLNSSQPTPSATTTATGQNPSDPASPTTTVSPIPPGPNSTYYTFKPTITYPDASANWTSGSVQNVTWDTSAIPSNYSMTTAAVFLGSDSTGQEVITTALAANFYLGSGNIRFTLPNLSASSNYFVIFSIGGSDYYDGISQPENRSPDFSISTA